MGIDPSSTMLFNELTWPTDTRRTEGNPGHTTDRRFSKIDGSFEIVLPD
jgi:hypothetical protein